MPVLTKKTIARELWNRIADKARVAHATRAGEDDETDA